MSTHVLMIAGAVVPGVPGLVATFAPEMVLRAAGVQPSPMLMVLVQLLGAAWMGIAILNWMTRHGVIGGIYSRPLVVGNLLHCTAAGLALAKALPALPAPPWLWGLAVAYLALAVGFGFALLRHPLPPAA